MTVPTITRRLEFDAGHRVLGHEGKCANLHGHRYVAEVKARALQLDSVGRVIDFSIIKQKIGGWIDENWDHNVLLNSDDPLAPILSVKEDRVPYFFDKINPTAETMSEILFNVSSVLLGPHGIDVVSVRVYETPNCWADYPGLAQ